MEQAGESVKSVISHSWFLIFVFLFSEQGCRVPEWPHFCLCLTLLVVMDEFTLNLQLRKWSVHYTITVVQWWGIPRVLLPAFGHISCTLQSSCSHLCTYWSHYQAASVGKQPQRWLAVQLEAILATFLNDFGWVKLKSVINLKCLFRIKSKQSQFALQQGVTTEAYSPIIWSFQV